MTDDDLRAECVKLNARVVPYEDSTGDVEALMSFATRMQAMGLQDALDNICDLCNADSETTVHEDLDAHIDWLLAQIKERKTVRLTKDGQ